MNRSVVITDVSSQSRLSLFVSCPPSLSFQPLSHCPGDIRGRENEEAVSSAFLSISFGCHIFYRGGDCLAYFHTIICWLPSVRSIVYPKDILRVSQGYGEGIYV